MGPIDVYLIRYNLCLENQTGPAGLTGWIRNWSGIQYVLPKKYTNLKTGGENRFEYEVQLQVIKIHIHEFYYLFLFFIIL